MATYARVDKYGFLLTPFRKIEHTVANDGKSVVNRIALGDIVDEKGKVIVEDKALITEKDAQDIQKRFPEKTITVRGFLTPDFDYFDAYQERKLVIAEANTTVDEFGNFITTRISARANSEPTIVYVRDITHIDVSPKQITSVETSLIPFLEHDDATRAEMGSNMMRQAVPLIRPESPVVGTGMERIV